MTAPKKELVLTPKIEKVEPADDILFDEDRVPTIPPTVRINDKRDNNLSDSYFRKAMDHLNSPDNISIKTEYRDATENFMGAKLDFMGRYCFMPYFTKFIEMQELKRVSLERKGRKETVLMMEKREEEIRMQAINQGQMMMQNRQFGMG